MGDKQRERMKDDELDALATEVYADLAKYEREIIDHNNKILRSFGGRAIKNFASMLDHCDVTGKIEFVVEPSGTNQKEKYGVFKEVWVQQWNEGTEGDSFSGFIFARLIDNRWIKIPYSC